MVFTNNDNAYQTALDLADAGISVAGVVDARPDPSGALPEQVRQKGIEVIGAHVVVGVQGKKRVKGVEIMPLDTSGDSVEGKARRIACDLVAVSGGWTPTVHLHCQSGGKARWDHDKACFVPGQSVQPERSAGSCNGRFTLNECLFEGFVAGAEAAHSAGFGNGKFTGRVPTTAMIAEEPLLPMWVVPSRASISREHKQFVDLQADVSAADLLLAVREGYESIELVKRYTTLAMGTDQGKLSSINGMGILAKTLGKDIPSVGTTKYRPAYTPVSFGALASRDIGQLFDPVRKTAMHQWHEEAGAKFENVGQWKRPWYYPRRGETMHDTVNRECLATRSSVGILDASTLGKIDVQGPDAAEFLNRVYTNDRIKLAIGRCSYGFMLGEDGMVMDDGVTARFSQNHFVLTTTTGGASRVMAWLERWLQTEWPDLKVYLTSVTDHWATLSVAGPNSRRLITELCDDIDFSSQAFPFMSFREGTVAGAPARVFRISFSGERAYEINIPANYARAVWDALMETGKKYDITPYGTETMHVLRAEKGYIIAGQDTDGSVTPVDLGMDWIMSKHKDFLGKRSLSRPDSLRKDRKQLVGLLAETPTEVLPEGGQIVVDPSAPLPMEMMGHVTSSYFSACLGRSIALAVVKGGHTRIGQTVYVSHADGRTVRAVIAKPVFYDPEGARQRIEGGSTDSDSVNRSAFRLRRESPLVQFNGAEPGKSQNERIGVQLCERPFLGHLNLRGNPADLAFLQGVERVLGFALPLKPNTVAESRELTALWLGPDEWLLLTPPDREAGIAQALRNSLGNLFFAIIDISSGQTVINIRGNQARDVLAKGCSLDLHPRHFYPGCCAQTHIAKATVLIRQQDHSPSFDLVVRRSFAEYLALWLKDAAQEYGLVTGSMQPIGKLFQRHEDARQVQ
ncbi:MAG: sarcosine oxidase subunit alpha [Acidobacteria bacterium]|nr:MAG: sarcosine oxidase subunit alpha [Acidobacteriota bacterium]